MLLLAVKPPQENITITLNTPVPTPTLVNVKVSSVIPSVSASPAIEDATIVGTEVDAVPLT